MILVEKKLMDAFVAIDERCRFKQMGPRFFYEMKPPPTGIDYNKIREALASVNFKPKEIAVYASFGSRTQIANANLGTYEFQDVVGANILGVYWNNHPDYKNARLDFMTELIYNGMDCHLTKSMLNKNSKNFLDNASFTDKGAVTPKMTI